jgi:hypothetical protein
MMQNRYLNTSVPGLLRDTKTGMIINNNDAELNQYMNERNRVLQQEVINKKVNELTDTVSEIKEMLKILMRNKNGN